MKWRWSRLCAFYFFLIKNGFYIAQWSGKKFRDQGVAHPCLTRSYHTQYLHRKSSWLLSPEIPQSGNFFTGYHLLVTIIHYSYRSCLFYQVATVYGCKVSWLIPSSLFFFKSLVILLSQHLVAERFSDPSRFSPGLFYFLFASFPQLLSHLSSSWAWLRIRASESLPLSPEDAPYGTRAIKPDTDPIRPAACSSKWTNTGANF